MPFMMPISDSSFDLQGYTTLNRIQSIVYPTAYETNENMLICGEFFCLVTRKEGLLTAIAQLPLVLLVTVLHLACEV